MGLGCTADADVEVMGPSRGEVVVTDEGRASGYQDFFGGSYKRGRGAVVADFDGDGDPDLFTGNPGNASFLMRNDSTPGGPLRLVAWQTLSPNELFYGGVAADFDNDGDQDLFVSAGANDGEAQDRLFLNEGSPSEPLVDVTETLTLAAPNRTMGVRAFDANLDGRLDLWASNGAKPNELATDPAAGINQLYIATGAGVDFEDQALSFRLTHRGGSRHASVFDYDRDGDMDIYENNFLGPGVMWRNRLVEDGVLTYQNVTQKLSLGHAGLEGSTLDHQAMCSLPADFNNDGWEDLLILNRGRGDGMPNEIRGHQLFLNLQGQGFVDVGDQTGLSVDFHDHPNAPVDTGPMGRGWGVMGCQVGDINLDGFPDVFIGTGVAAAGDVDRLFVSSERVAMEVGEVGVLNVPRFESWTDLLDFPADAVEGAPSVPYPYRTHGTALADYDGDGVSELGVHNGGPAKYGFMEPNRLWKFHLPDPRFLRIRLDGDGLIVNRDGIGAQVRVRVRRDADDAEWDLYKTRHAATGFGAQNEAELVFGLADADEVVEVEVTWPDGFVQPVEPPSGTSEWMTVARSYRTRN